MFSMITYNTLQFSCVVAALNFLCSGSDFLKLFHATNCAVNLESAGGNKSFEDNFNHCNESTLSFNNNYTNLTTVGSDFELSLICRDAVGVTLEIKTNGSGEHPGFLLMIKAVDQILGATKIIVTKSPVIVVEDLYSDTEYIIKSYAFYGDNTYSIINNNFTVRTLSEDFQPMSVTDLHFNYMRNNESSYRLDVLVNWTRAEDQNCNYDAFYFADDRVLMQEFRQMDTNSYLLHLNDTHRNICVSIISRNLFHENLESKFDQCDEAPSCLEWHNNDLDACAPPAPENVTSEIVSMKDHVNHSVSVDVQISWNTVLIPEYYIVNIFNKEVFVRGVKVTGNLTTVLMQNVVLFGDNYEIVIRAFSKGGSSTASVEQDVNRLKHVSDSISIYLLVMGPAAAFVLIVSIAIHFFHRQAKLKRYRKQCRYFEDLEQKAPVDEHIDFKPKDLTLMYSLSKMCNELPPSMQIHDEMEVPQDRLRILNILGEGAFGLVKMGVLKKHDGTEEEVAVKMLKDFPSTEEIKEFRAEIEVMKLVGKHENIVSIIGHCTKTVSHLILLTEYCARGNLLCVLRSEWEYLTQIVTDKNGPIIERSPKLINLKHPENVFNFDISFIEKASQKYKKIADALSKQETEPESLDLKKLCSEQNNNNANNRTSSQIVHDNNLNNLIINKLYDELANECHHASNVGKLNIVKEPEPHSVPIECICQLKSPNKFDLNTVDNVCYDVLRHICCDDETGGRKKSLDEIRLTSNDLISFARQIASGMKFLSMNKVVHRDLAARNVLVSNDKTVKIADFGLSRDIYRENMYKKKGNGKLPIKWLALESMTHQVYSSQSDVWSFGILLYEIVTLGGTPYPSTATDRLLQLLRTGYRMGKPSNCSDELYSLMSSCWNANPGERPTFSSISDILSTIDVEPKKNQFIEMLVLDTAMRKKLNSGDSYLKPII